MKKTKETRKKRIEKLTGIFSYCSQKLSKDETKAAISTVLDPVVRDCKKTEEALEKAGILIKI